MHGYKLIGCFCYMYKWKYKSKYVSRSPLKLAFFIACLLKTQKSKHQYGCFSSAYMIAVLCFQNNCKNRFINCLFLGRNTRDLIWHKGTPEKWYWGQDCFLKTRWFLLLKHRNSGLCVSLKCKRGKRSEVTSHC